jgi:hypothetical protein
MVFNTNARATRVAGDPLTDCSLVGNGSVTVEPQGVAKVGNGKSYTPRFEYNRGDLTVEGRASVSDSISEYDPMGFGSFFKKVASIIPDAVKVATTVAKVLPLQAGPQMSPQSLFQSPFAQSPLGTMPTWPYLGISPYAQAGQA